MTRGELVVVVFFVLAIAIVGGFLTVALTFPELLPWYSNPSPRSSPPASTFWEHKSRAATHAEVPGPRGQLRILRLPPSEPNGKRVPFHAPSEASAGEDSSGSVGSKK
jgi:hypothetical protein